MNDNYLMETRSRADKPAKKPLKPKQAIRRSVLGSICLYWFDNNQSALAHEIGVDPSFIINRLSGERPIGEEAADQICSKLAIPQGSLDTPIRGPLGPRGERPFHKRGVDDVTLSDTNLMRALKLQQIPEGTPEKRIIDSAIDTALEEQRRRAAEEKQRERKQ